MNNHEKNNLLYLCSIIEYLGRVTQNRRADIVDILGKKELERQFRLAEVNHCLSMEQVTDELISEFNIIQGTFDSVGASMYQVPSVVAIAKDYQKLILDICQPNNNIIDILIKVFQSFISDEISDFNSSVFYSSPEYLKLSYEEGKLLA